MNEKIKPFPKRLTYLTAVTQAIVSVSTRFISRFLFDIKVVGVENILPYKGELIFAANHTSDLDPILITNAIPSFLSSQHLPLVYVAKKNKNYKWEGWRRYAYAGGFLFWIMGAYSIKNIYHDYAASLEIFVRAGLSKRSMLIFIGGFQKNIHERIKIKGGTGYLNWATGIPVVPVAIVGASGMTWKQMFQKRHTITIEFGKPFTKEELFSNVSEPTYEDFKNASEIVVKEIEKKISENI